MCASIQSNTCCQAPGTTPHRFDYCQHTLTKQSRVVGPVIALLSITFDSVELLCMNRASNPGGPSNIVTSQTYITSYMNILYNILYQESRRSTKQAENIRFRRLDSSFCRQTQQTRQKHQTPRHCCLLPHVPAAHTAGLSFLRPILQCNKPSSNGPGAVKTVQDLTSFRRLNYEAVTTKTWNSQETASVIAYYSFEDLPVLSSIARLSSIGRAPFVAKLLITS